MVLTHNTAKLAYLALISFLLGFAPVEAAFVEDDVEVIYEVWGENAGDTFGFVLEPVGDLNADGVAEFLTSAPYYIEDSVQVGKAYLLDGATGAVLREHLGQTSAGRFGFRLASIGDFDSDDTADYAIGAPGDEGSAIDGEVFVYSGDLSLPVGTSLLWQHESTVPGARLGRGLGAAGDVDGDGYADVLAGAPLEDGQGSNSGTVYVYSGQTQEVIRFHEGSSGDRLGQSCRSIGQVTADEVAEYILGGPGGGVTGDGMALVIDGGSGEVLYSVEPEVSSAQEFAGFFANSPGDMNGDGVPDLFIGDYEDNGAGFRTGHTHLFDGSTGARFSYDITGDSPNDWNGFGGRELGDFDQDGSADFITNFFNNVGTAAPRAGRVVVYSGASGEVLRSITSLEGNASGSTGEWFGYDVTGIGDVNGDNIPDILVSAGLNNEAGSSAGKVYVIAGRWETPSSTPPLESAAVTLSLRAAQPNPFRAEVNVHLRLPRPAEIAVGIFDSSGRSVRRLQRGHLSAGDHVVVWDGKDDHGFEAAAGVYQVRLGSEGVSASAQVVHLK